MFFDRENVERWINEFHKKAERAYDNYQETGKDYYEKTWRKYQDLEACLTVGMETQADVDNQRARRANNISDVAEKLEDRNYTKKEVVSLLLRIAYW
ncbi:MAG: hypothetical protein J1G30_01255 [Spirochaetales bacterium]|nr:hypothetical protein [Spirochaetales bacterium]